MMSRARPGTMQSPKRLRGSATVEAAIAIPLLLLLTLATAELGRAFVQYTVLANAVRNAARHAAGKSLLGTTQTVFLSADLVTQTRNLVVFGNETGSGSSVLPGLTPGNVTVSDAGSNNVLVSAVYPYQAILGATLPTFGIGDPIPLAFNMSIAVTMRAL